MSRFLEVLLHGFGSEMRGNCLDGRRMSSFGDKIWLTNKVELKGTFLI